MCSASHAAHATIRSAPSRVRLRATSGNATSQPIITPRLAELGLEHRQPVAGAERQPLLPAQVQLAVVADQLAVRADDAPRR